MPLSFMTETVTVLRAPLVDRRGTKVRDWANAVSHELHSCLVTGVATSQDRDGRVTQVDDRRRLRCMYDADVEKGDRVVWGGITYEVDGEVFKTKSPTGRVSSTRCTLARWEG